MGRASVGVARKRGLMKRFCATPTEALFVSVNHMPLGKGMTKRFCATPTEALFVSGGYMPLGKGDDEAFLMLTYRAFSI